MTEQALVSPQVFRYLHDIEYCWRVTEPSPCAVCERERPGYGFLVEDDEGDETPFTVCEPCLVAGRLAETGLTVNTADAATLLVALEARGGEPLPHERKPPETIAAERTAEVELRTPRPMIFNAFTWPVHCDDYLIFHRPVVAEDLEALAPNGDGRAFLASHLHPECAADADDELLDNVWSDRLRGFLRFYLWRCPVCAEYALTYDAD